MALGPRAMTLRELASSDMVRNSVQVHGKPMEAFAISVLSCLPSSDLSLGC